ncbi:glycosyl transferase family 17 [Candidatus Pelagibacter sp. Uisw_134_02]|uniref:glycosyl transferase family 17 n=1 Tax=Candidatus Pelagibacter sp. Uisw_134_02 TaxID=3230990 RepID=UPI0039E9AC8D
MSNKIFDCTTFYNANMLFDLRYHSLKNYVDYFVVCEANKTHTGQYKGYNFDKDFMSKYGEKIIYIQVDDLPEIKIKGKKDYQLLKIQMENLFRGITKAQDNDLIILSDEDEIPNPSAISNFKKNDYKFGLFLQNMYYYKLNILGLDEGNGNWAGSRICKKKHLKSFFNFRILKEKNINYPFWRIDKEKSVQLIQNGGWHFTYLMTPGEISKKIENMSHTEFNKGKFKNIDKIRENINNLIDPFDRNLRLKKVKIDDTYPEYLLKNVEKYKDWILN